LLVLAAASVPADNGAGLGDSQEEGCDEGEAGLKLHVGGWWFVRLVGVVELLVEVFFVGLYVFVRWVRDEEYKIF